MGAGSVRLGWGALMDPYHPFAAYNEHQRFLRREASKELVETKRQQESAFIVAGSMFLAGLVLLAWWLL